MSEIPLLAREFLGSPFRTATLVPSSPQLVQRLIAPIPERGEPVVVELGPGTGPVTEAIRRRLAGRGRYIAVELNERLASHLVQRFPDADVVVGPAVELPRILAERGLHSADVVVSGLPLGAFTGPHGRNLVPVIASALSEPGVYTQFTYTVMRSASPSRRRLAQLCHHFEEVVASRTIPQLSPGCRVFVPPAAGRLRFGRPRRRGRWAGSLNIAPSAQRYPRVPATS